VRHEIKEVGEDDGATNGDEKPTGCISFLPVSLLYIEKKEEMTHRRQIACDVMVTALLTYSLVTDTSA
jgi:hypothetical protein